MCILDEYITENCLSMESIRKYVDDYSIISHYIGEELELRRVYPSPIRDSDEHPSFSIFETKRGDIVFKDHGMSIKGNVFQFVQYILSENKTNLIPFKDVFNQINLDFDLGLEGTPKTFQPRAKIITSYKKKEQSKIEIVSKKKHSKKFLDYFAQYDISKKTLQLYNVHEVALYKYRYGNNSVSIYPRSLCIAFRIGKYYKLYFPFESKENKFRNDFPKNYVEGFQQLRYKSSSVLITKASKEVLFFREHFNLDSVAGKSENTMIPDFLMKLLFERYKNVLLWLDRDNGGAIATKNYLKKYPQLIFINYPEYIEQKDPTDRYAYLKLQQEENKSINEIQKILCQYII